MSPHGGEREAAGLLVSHASHPKPGTKLAQRPGETVEVRFVAVGDAIDVARGSRRSMSSCTKSSDEDVLDPVPTERLRNDTGIEILLSHFTGCQRAVR